MRTFDYALLALGIGALVLAGVNLDQVLGLLEQLSGLLDRIY